MKIAFFLTGFGKSGGPLIHYNFMNGLFEKKHDVYIVTQNESFKWYKDAHKDFIDKKIPRKINLKKIKKYFLNKISKDTLNIFKTKEIISEISKKLIENYQKLSIESDILIASHTYTAEAVYKLGENKKMVMYNMHFEELMFENNFDRSEIRALNYLPFNHISLSTWLHEMFKYNYKINSEIITPGIDENIFNKPLNKEKYLDIKKPIKIITYCDPYRKFKAIGQQIEILKKLSSTNKDIEIIIYGHDPKTNLFPYKFLGWISQSDLSKHYSESHLLISFSWYESFPLPPIEAMACGCTVVAGRYGTEDYLKDNQSGIIINPFNTDESAEKISTLIKDPEKMLLLATNAKKIADDFIWENQINKLNDFLLKIPTSTRMNIEKIQRGNLEELDKIYE